MQTASPHKPVVRRQEIELIRIVCAFGIVWYHCRDIAGKLVGLEEELASGPMFAFLMISLFFAVRPSARIKPVMETARRLMKPWLIWFVFFGCVNLAMQKDFLNTEHGLIGGILIGTKPHLWYLPFIFFSIISFQFVKRRMPEALFAYSCAAIALLMLMTAEHWRPWSMTLAKPLPLYIQALTGMFIGAFMANSTFMPLWQRLGIIAAFIAAAAWFSLSVFIIGIPYIIAIVMTSLALIPKWTFQPRYTINWLSDCTMGIYLTHLLWFSVLTRLDLLVSPLAAPFIVFAASAAGVLLMKRFFPSLANQLF
ncbi:MAG TPA: acyltransferase family protein [Pseudomonadales bacterium]